jgi:hypothetical protein
VTVEDLIRDLGEYEEARSGGRELTRKSVRRIARAAWNARQRGLLLEAGRPMTALRQERPREGRLENTPSHVPASA